MEGKEEMRPSYDVLVVEDEEVVVESVERILVSEGFSVDAAGSSEEATQKLQRCDYGIILIDIVLPGVSGLQLTEILSKSHPGVITITFSGLATRENVIESFLCGAFDFIPKPFSFEELLGAIQRATRLLRQRQESVPSAAERGGGTPEPPAEAWREYRFLGDHIWAKFEDDGSAVMGVDDTFAEVLEQVDTVEFPNAFEEIKQGHACVRMSTKEKIVHLVWCPVSGVVVESNADIAETRQSGHGTGAANSGTWLLRVWPKHAEEEMKNLKTYHQR